MASVRVFDDLDALARGAAEEIVSAARLAVEQRGRFTMALSGGSTPRVLYATLASSALRERMPWARTWLYQGDERRVAPEHADSNFRMQWETLLGQVPLPPARVVRFHSEGDDVELAARHYESMVRRSFRLAESDLPAFDVALLGLGPDGHTASLFPDTAALAEDRRLAVASRVERLGVWRFTLTPGALNRARLQLVLVAGADKAETLRAVLEGPLRPAALPAQLLAPIAGDLHWLVERSAAAALQARRDPDARVESGKRQVNDASGEHADESALVDRLQDGDAAAFEELVRSHGARLLAVTRRILHDEEEARDALQDCLLSAHRSIAKFSRDSRLSTWLHRIAVNAALMRLRSRRRRPEEPIDDLLPRFDASGHHLAAVVEWRDDAQQLLEQAEIRERVREEIGQLPESYRVVLVLRDIEELDTRSVAAMLGASENAVKIRLHRARQALRTRLEPHFRKDPTR